MPDRQPVGVLAGPAVGAADFRYHRPRHPEEVDALFAEQGHGMRLLAGGTDLLVQIRSGDRRPRAVVDISDLESLGEITVRGAEVTVGAAVPLWRLREHREVRRRFAALREGAACVGSLQIQSRATLVGNLCNASPAADTAPAVLVYDGRVNVRSARGRRVVPAAEFWEGPRATALAADEWVESVTLRDPGPHGSAYAKLGRSRGVDLALVAVAVLVRADGARVACASLAPTVRRLGKVESLLDSVVDRQIEPESSDLATTIAAEVQPISDIRASAGYRLAMAEVCVRRAHATAAARRGATA